MLYFLLLGIIRVILDTLFVQHKMGTKLTPNNFLWQSFDYPCDTFLPEMKICGDLVTGLDRYLSSWKSTEDPTPGEFLARMDYRGLPQVLLMK